MGQSSLHPPQNGSKVGLQMAKRRTIEIPNCWVMKLGNPKHDKYGTRKLAKGGYHGPLQSASLYCFQILVACIWALLGVTKRSPAGTRSELEKGPNRISARQGRRLRRTAFWDKGAKNHLKSRESNCRYPKHRKARYTRNWRP